MARTLTPNPHADKSDYYSKIGSARYGKYAKSYGMSLRMSSPSKESFSSIISETKKPK